MFKRKRIIIITSIIISLIAILLIVRGIKTDYEAISVMVRHGNFEIEVTTNGELESESSVDIKGPNGLQQVRIWQIQISDIVAEGTLVDSGQYVASLDKTEISNKLKDIENELEKLESQLIKMKLDTSMELRSTREEIISTKFQLEERKITVDQSIYEPPATQRHAQIELEKAERAYNQIVKTYQLRLDKAIANMNEISASYLQTKRHYDQMSELLSGFVIFAPKSGMIIYKRNWDGSKLSVGANVSAWDNVVATLPNLSKMISKTFVNEIDISKIKEDQNVEIEVDAFPDRKFSGSITSVANIGEVMRGSNAKVFEVIIKINETDTILRPSMTTKNKIMIEVINDVLYVPLECVHTEDSITFVYMTKERVKQEVRTGKSNDNFIIIESGLKLSDEVLLSKPEDIKKWKLKKL